VIVGVGVSVGVEVGVEVSIGAVVAIGITVFSTPLQKVYPTSEGRVVCKRGSYVATGAILLPGMTVGKESLVAAGAVVTKSIPDHVMVAGVPAVVKKRLKMND